MVGSVIGANEETIRFRNYDALGTDLGFTSMLEMKTFINSKNI